MLNSLRFFLANKITIQPIPPLLISGTAMMTEPTTIVDKEVEGTPLQRHNPFLNKIQPPVIVYVPCHVSDAADKFLSKHQKCHAYHCDWDAYIGES
jgi:hypothetical protein